MTSKIFILGLLCVLQLTNPVWSTSSSADNSDTLTSDEIVPPSLSSSPLLVQSPHFIPTSSLFLPSAPENAVTSDGVELLLNEDDVDQINPEEITDRPPVNDFIEGQEPEEDSQQPESTSWNVLEEQEEIDTESSPTIAPEDLIQTQAIPIESYVVTDRKAKSELLPPNRNTKDSFLSDSSLDLTVKNLTSDPEDLENALFNDTTGTSSSSVEDMDQVGSGSMEHGVAVGEESSVVTDREFETKQIVTQTPTTTTTTTTHAPVINHSNRKKQPKYIKKFRASASEVLRFFMEGSYLRSPLAVLVDTSDKTLEKTKILWNATLQQSTANIDMVLVTFDHSGIYATYKFNNSRTLVAGLNSIQPSSNTDHEISTHTDNVFSTIIRASERIPYDSAIFLFTNSEPKEDDVAQTAAIMLLKKRIRLYLFWFGGVNENDEESSPQASHHHHRNQHDVAGILGEVTLRTGGEIVYMSGEAIHANGDIGTVTLQLRNSFQGVQPFGVALTDSETNSVTRSHESSEESKLLVASPGLEETSSNVRTNNTDQYPRNMNQDSLTHFVNINVIVFVHNVSNSEVIFSPDTISRVALRTSENLRFPDNNQQTSVLENEEATSNALDIDQDDNIDDVEIVIPSIDSRQSSPSIESNTQVLVSPQSKLTSLPGTQAQILFEVTNLRTQATYYNFNVIDEKEYVRRTQIPIPVLVGPGLTITVTVNLFIPNTAVSGQRNKVTFTARGVTDVQQSVWFTVAGQNPVQDTWAPNLYWNYGSRCEWKTTPGICSQHVWSVEITAQDWDTGILRLQSTPKGLLLRNGFTAGTRDPVIATYSASCCQPRVTITAFDAANNQKTVTLDVTDIWLSEAGIAAVVVGVLLFIVLVILIVILCIWCVRRRKQTQELPVYRSRARSRQETQT